MSILKGDYIGFTFNGVHSSSLGIVRVSDGSRYNENLLPSIQDKTIQVPGGDGMYYFGSYYTQKQISISYAFDALTEEQLAHIKVLFGDKKIHELIFDEAPYKAYQAKVTGTAQIKYIPFDEGSTGRVYKGEGSVQFTAYNPYARSVSKDLKDFSEWTNIDEWKDSANLLQDRFTEGVDKINGNQIKIYNPGVKESDFILTLNFKASGTIPAGGISLEGGELLNFNEISSQNGDDQIKINTRLNIIEGYKNGRKSGRVYNKHIINGSFFKIPIAKDVNNLPKIIIDNKDYLAQQVDNIQYDYYYF